MNKQEALKRLKNIGLILLDDLPEKIDVKFDKFTFKDKDGYKYYLSFSAFRDKRTKGHSIFYAFNPYSKENAQLYINKHGGTAIVLDVKWKNGRNIVKLKCQDCGKIFDTNWYSIYAYHKFQCNSCGHTGYKDNKKIDTEKICAKHHYKIIEGTYKSRHSFDLIDKEGYKYSNCNVYGLDKRTNRFARFHSDNLYQVENMQLYIQKNNLGIKFVDENIISIKKDDLIKFYCIQCGDIYAVKWDSIIEYKKNRCNM